MTHAYQEIYLSKAQSILGMPLTMRSIFASFLRQLCKNYLLPARSAGEWRMANRTTWLGKAALKWQWIFLWKQPEKRRRLCRRTTMAVPENTGSAGQSRIISGFPAEGTATSSRQLPFEDLQKMYYTLHEADITKILQVLWMPGCGSSFYRHQSQTYPHDLRLHTGGACQAIPGQPPVDSDVRAAQQGYQ